MEISNNRAERSIKPFVMDKKNFLFANTPNGAHGSAISMIETAKENRLDPYRYLMWVLQSSSVMTASGPGRAEQLLPTNAPEVSRSDSFFYQICEQYGGRETKYRAFTQNSTFLKMPIRISRRFLAITIYSC